MTQIFKPNIHGFKVLTPTGYQNFTGVSLMGYRATIKLIFEDNKFIECTSDHKIYITPIKAKQACRIKIGETVQTKSGPLQLISKQKCNKKVPVYDLIGVDNGARFYANSILVSNCQPIIFEETLINAMTLSKLSAIDPVDKLGQVRWYKKPSRGNTYAIGMDPSLGTGGDYSAIEIYELPSFEQVGEWQHNKTPIQGQVRILRDIIKYIYDIIGTENDIYYSIENNGVGEATLMSISEVGEQNIKGIFLSEGGKSRKGFTTTHKSKLTACAKFKQLIEMGRLKINSKNLISELKTFVRANLSYAARVGDTDDLVSASLLVIRIMQTLQNYNSEIDNQMRANDDFVAPLPFIMI